MTNTMGESVSQFQPTQKQKHSDMEKSEWKYGYGRYKYIVPAQDQIIACIEGMKINGTFEKRADSQSDLGATSDKLLPKEINAFLVDFIKQLKQQLGDTLNPWEPEYSFDVEEPIKYVAVEEQVGDQAVGTTAEKVSKWTSSQLASAILNPQTESDMPHLREMILIAEDTDFTVEQSRQLSPWFLSFAQKYRNSNDPQDEAAIWSAIRTGASMLRPHDANCLRPLLDPGHSVETGLVTVKMLGRIFEAQPPAKVDEYQDLADEVYQIAESLLNRYAITSSQSAAMAHLAIYALAAMASSKAPQIVETVKQLSVMWFTRRTFRKLCELRNIWSSRPDPVADQPRKLLDRVIQMLELSDTPASGGTDAIH
jgi:hypothetical protein